MIYTVIIRRFIVLLAVFSQASAVPELSKLKNVNPLLQHREVCLYDDTLLSFQYWIVDSKPYCSSLLGIQDVTGTLPPATSRTTVTSTTSSVDLLSATVTVGQVTAFETITTILGRVAKREAAATLTSTVDVEPVPYAIAYNPVPSMLSDASRNASIASSVYSACSCLHITPSTVNAQSTTATTRTIEAIDYKTLAAATVTVGTVTIQVTKTVYNTPDDYYPIFSFSPATSTSVPSTVITAPSSYIASTISHGPYSYPSNSSSRIPTANSSGPIPLPPILNLNATATINPSPTARPSTSLLSDESLTPTGPSLPIGTSVNPDGCPTLNNTIYTVPGTNQQYQLQCYRKYGGPNAIGLDEPYFRECIQECSVVNNGFSAVRCFGVSWLKYGIGVHCNLKAQSGLASYTVDYLAVSAVLLTGVPPPVVGAFSQRLSAGTDGSGAEGKDVFGQFPDDDPGLWRVGVGHK
ncbi:MAG: hypothetical protein Q9167_004361 [Letrouitia subvulpina]